MNIRTMHLVIPHDCESTEENIILNIPLCCHISPTKGTELTPTKGHNKNFTIKVEGFMNIITMH